MSIYSKLAAAQTELGDLPRDRTVNTGKYSYSYVTEDAITSAIRRVLSPMGVALTVSWTTVERDGDMTTVTGEVMFADGETNETAVITIVGCGSDSSDKGLSKAQTSALRIGLCKTFLQAGDDDGEAEENPRKSPKANGITDGQRRALFAAARGKGLDEEALRGLVAEHRDGNQSTQGMPVAVFDAIMAQLAKLDAIPSPPAAPPEPAPPIERSLEEWANEHWDAVMRHATDLGMTGPGATAMLAVAGFKRPTDLVKEGDLASTVLVDEAVRVLTNELARRGGAA
jgi:hypothetical protein